jgi:hypothetical protein
LVESGGSSTTTCTLWIEAELWQRSSSCTQHLVHREGALAAGAPSTAWCSPFKEQFTAALSYPS